MSEVRNIKLKYHIIHHLPKDSAQNDVIQKLTHAKIAVLENDCEFDGIKFDFNIHVYNCDSGSIVEIQFSGCEKDADSMENLEQRIRTLKVKDDKKRIDVIRVWDGLSLFYSRKVESLITDIELWFREVISTYYHVAMGKTFSPSFMPNYSDNAEKRKNDGDGIKNELNACDMSFLKNAFLHPFSESDGNSKADFMKDLDDCKDGRMSFDSFYHKYERRTIAEKISSQHYQEIEDFFRNNWDDLYQVRCAWAHHRYLRKDDVNHVTAIYKDARNIYTLCMAEIKAIKPSDNYKKSAENLRDLLLADIQNDYNISLFYRPEMMGLKKMSDGYFQDMDRPQFFPKFYVSDIYKESNLMNSLDEETDKLS